MKTVNMSSLFKQISKIDDRTKYSVYGWIRKAEYELKLGHIPMMIQSICILYVRDDEMFEIVSNGISLSDNKRVIRSNLYGEDYYYYCYGLVKVDSRQDCIYQWDLKIAKCPVYGKGVRFGIASCNKESKPGSYVYQYDNDGTTSGYGIGWVTGSDKAGEGDTLSVCLDLKRKKVNFYVNDKKQITVYENIETGDDLQYRLKVAITNNRSVEIMRFSFK